MSAPGGGRETEQGPCFPHAGPGQRQGLVNPLAFLASLLPTPSALPPAGASPPGLSCACLIGNTLSFDAALAMGVGSLGYERTCRGDRNHSVLIELGHIFGHGSGQLPGQPVSPREKSFLTAVRGLSYAGAGDTLRCFQSQAGGGEVSKCLPFPEYK